MDNINENNLSFQDLFKRYNTSPRGLSSTEASNRLNSLGFNEIEVKNEKIIILRFLGKFLNPLMLMLIFVAGISFFFGETVNAIIIILMALLSAILAFVQEYNASKASKKLKAMVKITSKVIRDGRKIDIPLREIVPGDIIELTAGKMVPSDVRIIKSNDLYINQSSLTGESFPVKKVVDNFEKKVDSIYDFNNLAFMGSSVSSGIGEALVLRTGRNSEFGKLSKETIKTSSNTSFEKGVNGFTWLMIRFTFFLVVFIFIVNAIFKNNIIDSLLFSLAIAIGLTPEMLPMEVTINLSKGAIDMAKKKVIVKVLASIQNFGAMDVLCTDKTGTLTINDITLIRHCDANGSENDNILRMAYLNSYFQTGLDNLLDGAVINHKKFSIENIKKIDELPFDFNRRIMSVIVEEKDSNIIVSKGAPEEIIKRSKDYAIDNSIVPVDRDVIKNLNAKYDDFSKDGFRVLAVAYKNIEVKKEYTDKDENDLTFLGFIAFLDPPKPTAAEAISQIENLGINLKVLSGDNELVTKQICSEVKINVSNVISGNEIDKFNDFELSQKVEDSNVFIRLSPFQKERVINALKNNGHTVGYLGDGINDAPALKAADVGISVDNATDIAKETAEIILLEKSLLILADCVAEGRKTFANVIKYIKMGASSNFGNMLSMTGASIFLPFLPMLPTQILLNNFLYDTSQVALPTDSVDKEFLLKPKPWDIKFIKEFMLYIGPISSIFDFATFGVMWYIFRASPELFHTGWFVESLATQVLVVYIIRTSRIPFLESMPSPLFLFTTLGIVLLGIIIPYTFLGKIIGFTPLPGLFFIILMIMVLFYLVLVQIVKNWFIKKFGYE